ncbi:tRNAHis guanylyltransferase family protein [Hyella patelloides LEGE 07179]|uniref:tRNA(His) guanylyltransferase n=1 Tax=Hyella patelloides LEGE 07179 TaxID=945734 RepID=A0A563VKH7_9CYAN|nr:tRNA(His) guanylyltransferase Thg1 family protein [Hyella patelloides]VEP11857.1 tRNAHis guanylyltransferase family protein [Hyella patelloides LEGE 07179]
MQFEILDKIMRIYETAHDHSVLPGIYMVARLDGRNFTRLTKEKHQFKAPFDKQFRDYMLTTVEHLMTCGFKVLYGYTQSDEISLLLDLVEDTFNRKLRKLNSVLASEASAKFSLLLGNMGCFDCRISQLPNISLVVDYFRWRQQDAYRNSLSSHCYWCLRRGGYSARKATSMMSGLSQADKHELLFEHNINYNDLPSWEKRGSGLYWESYQKVGYNPITEEDIVTNRNRIKRDLELPMKDEYSQFILNLLETSS